MQFFRLNVFKWCFFPIINCVNANNQQYYVQMYQEGNSGLYLSDITCNKCHPNWVLHLTTLFSGALNAASSNSGTFNDLPWNNISYTNYRIANYIKKRHKMCRSTNSLILKNDPTWLVTQPSHNASSNIFEVQADRFIPFAPFSPSQAYHHPPWTDKLNIPLLSHLNPHL